VVPCRSIGVGWTFLLRDPGRRSALGALRAWAHLRPFGVPIGRAERGSARQRVAYEKRRRVDDGAGLRQT
jgi:hypothetical protein